MQVVFQGMFLDGDNICNKHLYTACSVMRERSVVTLLQEVPAQGPSWQDPRVVSFLTSNRLDLW